MQKKQVIMAFDVGGTFSKGTVFSNNGDMLLDGVAIYESESQKSSIEIISNFTNMIQDLYDQLLDSDVEIAILGMAFPGPFDYTNGVSKIQGLNKFDSLYGVNIKLALIESLRQTSLPLSTNFSIFFENDATCFAFGEFFFNRQVDSGGYFTLGTGLGSSFIKEGKFMKGQGRIPQSGMIFNEPYKSGIVDDYLSARGLKEIVNSVYKQDVNLQELYFKAKNFDKSAIEVFRQYGLLIGRVVTPYVKGLQLDEIVFGGQISKSFEFFGEEIQKYLLSEGIKTALRATKDTSISTIRGLFYLEDGGLAK